MLHELLGAYLQRIHHVVSRCSGAHVEHYTEEVLTPERVNLRIRIRLGQGHLVEISEAVVAETDRLVPLDYRYHCQDESNRLVFRYDCTPHFPGLPGFPHHKHVPGAVLPSTKPDIAQVVAEAAQAGPGAPCP